MWSLFADAGSQVEVVSAHEFTWPMASVLMTLIGAVCWVLWAGVRKWTDRKRDVER